MLIALRRRLRLQLPLAPGRCGSTAEPGCGRSTDAFWRPCTRVPSNWPSWQGGPNLWSGPGARLPVKPSCRGGTWCPNNGSSTPQRQASRPTTASALTSSSTAPHHWMVRSAAMRPSSRLSRAMASPHPGVAAVLRTAYRGKQTTYPELAAGGAPELCVLGCEVGGRWNADAVKLVQRLVALGAHRAPPSACESFLGLLLVESALRSGSASRRSHSAGTRPGLAGTGTCRCAGPG